MKNTGIFLSLCLFFCATAVAQKNGIYNVADFGARGDGKRDCSAAFQKAMDAIVRDGGGQLFIPKGEFLILKQVQAEAPKLAFSILGLGLGVSNLLCDNSEGVFRFRYTEINSQITLRDFSLFAMREGAGTAIDIEHRSKGNSHHRALMVENVEMRSHDNRKDYFDVGLRAQDVWRPIFSAVVFAGPFGRGVSSNLSESSPIYRARIAFDVSGAYAPRFQNCYAWSAQTGYKLVDPDNPGAEDGTLLNSYAVECAIGVDVMTTGVEPQLLIDGGHYNCRDVGIKIVGRKFVNIVNCLMYNVDLQNQGPSNYVDIYLENCNNVIVANNIFQFKGRAERTNVMVTGRSFSIDIKQNRFNAYANAVTVEAGCKDVNFTGNGFAPYVTDKLRDRSGGGVITDIKL